MTSKQMDIDPLAEKFISQGGYGSGHNDDLLGHLYVGTSYVERGHGIINLLASQFRLVKPMAPRVARSLGREALDTGAQIHAVISTKLRVRNFKVIVAYRLAESSQRLVTIFKGGGRKRKRET